MNVPRVCCAALALLAVASLIHPLSAKPVADDPAAAATKQVVDQIVAENQPKPQPQPVDPGNLPDFLQKGIAWLIAAQHNDGGWGGGSHAQQSVRDPHAIQTDPATTAFTLLSLMRAGHTPVEGLYQSQAKRGLEYLLTAVEKSKVEGPLITDIEGTQPQIKLGRYVDTAMTSQYLSRVLPLVEKDEALHKRVDAAIDKCLAKLQVSQQADGSWGKGGGWAPVLQSSLSCSALEIAAANGKEIDKDVLEKARNYQKGNFDSKSGKADASAAAGVELYAFNGSMRANAADAQEAQSRVDKAKAEGKLAASAPVSEESLMVAGVGGAAAQKLAKAAQQNEAQMDRLGDENLLKGFGNNGGEEYLSYLMTSESLVIAGGDKFQNWNGKMATRLEKVQNGDGSWSGHHCITSPVFCTAAVVQCLTTENDAEFLSDMAKRTNSHQMADAGK
ncbi:prenyltransferase/squalene oxidase repeat-containing protein [Bythopirellula goksoeyrii]|uniref:Squalene cyclase C-terminal domain-containing protein n=1 Tax=Bythopirellula goksoeyrii TaxID=1400387 RepID=A0A5B9QIE8_9BACT|nr:prenyltransferase/squalene oxidase repeat-containing protein [Bythopirellula goksoeyrii]QEG37769.1 hypothetical protein Pr1d_51160 [Bythopirellula goksoeyrii]